MVVATGLEPVTSSMSRKRATNCAKRPNKKVPNKTEKTKTITIRRSNHECKDCKANLGIKIRQEIHSNSLE